MSIGNIPRQASWKEIAAAYLTDLSMQKEVYHVISELRSDDWQIFFFNHGHPPRSNLKNPFLSRVKIVQLN